MASIRYVYALEKNPIKQKINIKLEKKKLKSKKIIKKEQKI
jgi:hypothetical protein